MSSGHYCDGCAQAYYKCICNKPQEKVKEQTIKMNERIRLLAEQCRGNPMTSEFEPRFDREKFAELIVRECMDVAKDHTPGTEECEYTWLIHDKIKEHFGVEE